MSPQPDVRGLSQRQLKQGDVVENVFLDALEKETTKSNKRISDIQNENPGQGPPLKRKPYDQRWTIAELNDAKQIFSQVLLKSKTLDLQFVAELIEIDTEILKR